MLGLVFWSFFGCIAQINAQSIECSSARNLTHNLLDEHQQFSEVTWNLTNINLLTGALVNLSCGPFVHETRSDLIVDAQMDIRMLYSQGLALWLVLEYSDQTDYVNNDYTAKVTAVSVAVGGGQLGMIVSFLNDDASRLAAGNYTTTITGTILGN